ncbi:hypothetical protein HanXRQr2_Chr14g0651811 [Helianthus annuus]|uniref:Uncharacterized protein n=1 Tax=Helianthus annuus TaxID=4232 RepID=A0A251TXD9_HELAN|nr:hypothetical protein HanXRQr2_Chr14g0651811 [Helianthus annuus]KAJ0840967.1 hypothetical protein HanPSC8_Chr14g0625041 [Helianthus annuus]
MREGHLDSPVFKSVLRFYESLGTETRRTSTTYLKMAEKTTRDTLEHFCKV